MPSARKYTIVPGQPGFFHCISRCVRRTWLCGTDAVSGNNYDHRRDWMVERMRLLTTCFAIDIYAYAFMENHYHIVLYVDPERVDTWTDQQIIKKWKTLWNWRRPDNEPVIPKNVSAVTIQEWRERLADVSWVMRLLNEPMARIANAEDDVKGHFWESRFKCRPLLDDQGLVTCMVYADLNPIKAGVAVKPEESDYTSIQQRIRQLADRNTDSSNRSNKPDDVEPEDAKINQRSQCGSLLPVTTASPEHAPAIGISQEIYIELVETTAEAIRNKRNISSADALLSLGIRSANWIRVVTDFVQLFRTAAGSEVAFTEFMQRTGRNRRQDATARRLLMM